MLILEEKAPRILNIIQTKLPEILDIIEQRLPQLLTETEHALPDLLDNIDEGITRVFDFLDGRLSPLLDILREDLPPILETLEGSLPGILDVLEARMEGLLDTFETMLPQLLDTLGANVVNVLDLLEGNLGEMLGIVANNLPPLLDSLEGALPTLLDRAAAVLPQLLSSLTEELPSVFDSFEGNLLLLEIYQAGLLSHLEETISTCFVALEQMLPAALQYVASHIDIDIDIAKNIDIDIDIDSTTDLLDMVEATLPQLPAMVDQRLAELLNYYHQYFASAKPALPSFLRSLAALLESISNPGYGQYPELGEEQWNFSIPNNTDSLAPWDLGMGYPGVLGDISLFGESLLGLFRSVLSRQGGDLGASPTCLGEAEETEICSAASCPN